MTLVVLEHAAVGVEHLAGLEGDGVEPALGAGELHPVARRGTVRSGCGGACGSRGHSRASRGTRRRGRRPSCPSRVGQMRVAGPPRAERAAGTPMVAAPEATAEASPVGESSIATHCVRGDAEQLRGAQVRLGMRLAVGDLVAGDDRRRRRRSRSRTTTCSAIRRDRHGDERGGDARPRAARRAARGRRGATAPRRAICSSTRSVRCSTISSALRSTPRDWKISRRVPRARADEREAVLVGPGAAEGVRPAPSRRAASTARCRRGCRPCPRGRRREAVESHARV